MIRGRVPRAIVCVLLFVHLSACMTWQPVELADTPPPPEELSEQLGNRIRVTRADSSRVVLEYVEVRGDSIAGVVDGGSVETIALSEARSVEAWRLEPTYLFVPTFVVLLWFFTEFPLDRDLPPAVTSDSPGE